MNRAVGINLNDAWPLLQEQMGKGVSVTLAPYYTSEPDLTFRLWVNGKETGLLVKLGKSGSWYPYALVEMPS